MALFSIDISHTSIFPSCILFIAISFTCSRASDLGLVKADRNGRITDFLEKPKGESLKSMVHALTPTLNTNNY
jgi:ADP-glucose pyrophosphorylase